jgi:hypothetical protein
MLPVLFNNISLFLCHYHTVGLSYILAGVEGGWQAKSLKEAFIFFFFLYTFVQACQVPTIIIFINSALLLLGVKTLKMK